MYTVGIVFEFYTVPLYRLYRNEHGVPLGCVFLGPVKGALYRIWCGVNRLGESGLKVV